MNIHYLQHVPFEGLGSIEHWLREAGHTSSCTHLYSNDPFPDLEMIDLLLILGGPMNIYEMDQYPWLDKEKVFIKKVIDNNKPVLGICLGAQLIADVLGAKVTSGKYREIGWFPVKIDNLVSNSTIRKIFPDQLEVFHWHTDTFDIPPSADLLYSSSACKNQAFLYRNKVLGLQFHFETTLESAQNLVLHCSDELVKGKYIQTPHEMMESVSRFNRINKVMGETLNFLTGFSR